MKRLSLKEAMSLVSASPSPAVSIYLATDLQGRDSSQILALNLRRLYEKVEKKIRHHFGLRGNRVLLDLQRALSNLKVEKARGGLAIFYSEGFSGILKIPTPIQDLAVAADSFHLKPVMKANQLRQCFFLLGFADHTVNLYKVSANHITRLDSTSYSPRNRESWLEHLNRKIDMHVSLERLPLLLAGSSFHQEEFRSTCTYPYIVEGAMSGDISRHSEKNLMNISSLFMEGYFTSKQSAAIQAFEHAEKRGETSQELETIAKAAISGNVRHLFIAEDRHIWGRLDRKTGRIKLGNTKESVAHDDILDDLAEETIRNLGQVTVLPSILMPDGQPVGAILKNQPHPKADVIRIHNYFSQEANKSGQTIRLSA